MARKATAKKPLTNSFTGSEVEKYLRPIMALHQDLRDLAGDHMLRCQKKRKAIAGLVLEAKQYGIPAQALKMQVKVELAKWRLKRDLDDLEKDQQTEVRMLAEARGDAVQTNLFGWNEPLRKSRAKAKRGAVGVTGDQLPTREQFERAEGEVADETTVTH